MKLKGLIFVFCFFTSILWAQVEAIKINKESFVKPTIASLTYLMMNVDSVKWNESLLSLGFKSLPLSQKVNALEYKKTKNGLSQYIGFDDRYWVLTIIYKDESGKNYISAELRKSLKGLDKASPGFYKLQSGGQNLVIGIESNKDLIINEMITVELERK